MLEYKDIEYDDAPEPPFSVGQALRALLDASNECDAETLAYTRNELEAFIGHDNLSDYDVDAIEEKVSRWDPETCRLVWTVEVDELTRVCMRYQKVSETEISSLNYELFTTAAKFGAVHDEYFDCEPGDYLIMYKLSDGSYGVFAKHDGLDGLLFQANETKGMCKYDGTPIEYSYWHLVA